jgi:hypothetical protein
MRLYIDDDSVDPGLLRLLATGTMSRLRPTLDSPGAVTKSTWHTPFVTGGPS